MDEHFYHEQAIVETNHWWYKGRRLLLIDFLKKYLTRFPNCSAKILDIGCGTGAMNKSISKLGEVIGVDSSPTAIAYCHRKGIENVQLASAEKLPFESQTFDFVTALDILEHLDNEQLNLLEWKRVVNNNGYILITVPAFKWLWGNQDIVSHHRRRYTRKQLAKVIEQAGLKIEKLTYFCFFMFPVIACVRLLYNILRWLGFKPKVKSDFTIGTNFLNNPLSALFHREISLLNLVNLPFGSSLLCLCRVEHY